MLGRSLLLSILTAASFVGCADASSDGTGSAESEIATVPITPIKQQTINNCWYYASAAWAESLHKAETGRDLDISESYGVYWDWYEKITHLLEDHPELDEMEVTGRWSIAAELMRHRGVYIGSFVSGDDRRRAAARQEEALTAINESLATGALKTRDSRRDRDLVRRELDRVWRLPADKIQFLDAVFGRDGSRTFVSEPGRRQISDDDTNLKRAEEIAVRLKNPTTGQFESRTLADAIGTPVRGDTAARNGSFAWSVEPYPRPSSPAKERAIFRRIQSALHDGYPVPISWNVILDARGRGMDFRRLPLSATRDNLRWAGHVSVVIDYEATVPGHGVVHAGGPPPSPTLLASLLEDPTEISFLRIKNSWGTSSASYLTFDGTNDLHREYLTQPLNICRGVRADGEPDLRTCSPRPSLGAIILPPEPPR